MEISKWGSKAEALKSFEESSGIKYDSQKPDWTLFPFSAAEQVVRVLEFGAKKYTRDNWQKVPDAGQRYLAAALRHLIARQGGEVNDAESGLPHLAHAGCCVLFALWFEGKEK